jgi:hypothetical protein
MKLKTCAECRKDMFRTVCLMAASAAQAHGMDGDQDEPAECVRAFFAGAEIGHKWNPNGGE